MSASVKHPQRMTVDEFLGWEPRANGDARHELIDGQPVAMAPPTFGHTRTILAVLDSLRSSIVHRGLPCEALPDGGGVRIDATTMFIPDVMVHCGERLDDEARESSGPLIVVEVASPSTERTDLERKLIGYFQLPSVRHYLIVMRDLARIIHHHRRDDGAIVTSIHGHEPITLDPPGMVLGNVFPPL